MEQARTSRSTRSWVLTAAFLALALFLTIPGATATHQPADKIAVSGSGLETMTVETLEGPESEPVLLAAGTMRTSSPTDLIFHVTAECALVTDVTTMNNQNSRAEAQVKVWVELDGVVVPVASDDANDPGRVVFCDRAYERNFLTNSDDQFTIETFLETRSANSFNWITLNVGSGIHEIEVWAALSVDRSGTGTGEAQAAVGKRTLIVEPVKLANDASI